MAKRPHLDGAPDAEHNRSKAALRVAQLGAQSQIFFANFEHRLALPLPARARPAGSDGAQPRFLGGVLAEPKYGAFRHDLLIASFHPGHRAQWTAHEICHALVGFGFRPSAPHLFHALAAWLAELLPVSLWYFFDEAGLRRCDLHRGQGPLFQLHCPDCEVAAARGPRPPDAEGRRREREGLAFMDRELAAVERARRLGRCVGTRYATIDLASDALAYAHGHAPRLAAPETARWVTRYFGKAQGMHSDLDSLTARVVAVRDAIVHGTRLSPHRASRWDYAAQDVGYRLLWARAELDDSRGDALDAMFEALADDRTEAGLETVVRQYEALSAERPPRRGRGLPSPLAMFSVGYRLVGRYGRSTDQIVEGVASACPSTLLALGRAANPTVASFIEEDLPARLPLGRRFARWLTRRSPGPVADLARLEAAITHAQPPDAHTRGFSADEARDECRLLASHAELVRVEHDVAGAAPERVSKLQPTTPRYLAVLRDAESLVDVMELPTSVGDALLGARTTPRTPESLGLPVEDLVELTQAGLLVPAAYRCDDLTRAVPARSLAKPHATATRRATRGTEISSKKRA
jgi:hypothetical protein